MRTLASLLAVAAIAVFGLTSPAHAGDFVVDLTADNGDDAGGILVGDVTVSGVSGNFTVTYDTSASSLGNGDWLIVEIHTHVDNNNNCDNVPHTRKGSPKVGHFDEATERSPDSAVDSDFHTILGFDGDDGEVDDIVCIAAHAVVFDSTAAGANPDEQFDNSEETAWGDGNGGTEFQADRGWATYFTVDLSDLEL